ncbi:TIGR04084 family radical SAM/SPASM domain-containing protein [Methanofollis fontis]|uniref:Putative peptide-modifying radical SAM/SPASM domain-containing protein n=1 Tax=Methanofollis fontis TaxID=2052832 RepID=A0A483CQJ8_9EURY|nr:TIGR04084 family radical SAM/SPASM domain-containing protein [Methanofollis fontis]TAJ44965.1 putative peptide-modifying radical SAM/SPASM domain-containing protein [Methanofollis fontis]
MYYHLILTDDCNLCCTYCRGKDFEENDIPETEVAVDSDIPPDLSYDLPDLYRFLRRDPEPVLTFYGGEPLLRIALIQEIIDDAPACRFMLQTNGVLLDRLDPSYAGRFSAMFISIDGPEALTNAHRGAGVYRRVMENVRGMRRAAPAPEMIARMTITENTDIYSAVLHCADLPDRPFDAVHWQIDANFWGDWSRRSFARWAEECYNPGIRRLVGEWLERMETGRVERWYPFLGCMADLLEGTESALRCGCGSACYTIMTDGRIVPCPCMVGMNDYYLGDIRTARPDRLPVVAIGGECASCDLLGFCGGRCLYSNVLRPWPPEGRAAVCGTVRNLHEALTEVLPRVRRLIREGTVGADAFAYERYNGAEIIP